MHQDFKEFMFSSATWDTMKLIEETQKPNTLNLKRIQAWIFVLFKKIQAAKEEKKPETKDIKFSSNSFSGSLQHGLLWRKWMKPKHQKYL